MAATHLGSPTEWQRLYAYNNRSQVKKRTGRGIVDPDLIYPGQKLLIPIIRRVATSVPRPRPTPAPRPLPMPEPRLTSLKGQLQKINTHFSTKYSLEDLPVMELYVPGYKAFVKFAGGIVIELSSTVPLATVSNKSIELSYQQQTKNALIDLVSDSKVAWDGKNVTYSSSLTLASKEVRMPKTTIAFEISSNKPVPILKAEFQFPRLSGCLKGKPFLGVDVKVIVEIEIENRLRPTPAARPLPVKNHMLSRDTAQKVTAWTIAIGATIIVGTIVADFLTAGASIADDPVTIGAGLALMGFGTYQE